MSFLTAKSSSDIRVKANQQTTVRWWETRRRDFDVYISYFVQSESRLGDPAAAEKRLAVISALPALEVTSDVQVVGKSLITEGPLPPKAETDAFHIAVAAVHGIQYLLTWNCTHIANAALRKRIESVCEIHGFEAPIICTPLELLED